ncbi:hypothetical protein Ancab_026711 [Ancistrocladus abbreviatus]
MLENVDHNVYSGSAKATEAVKRVPYDNDTKFAVVLLGVVLLTDRGGREGGLTAAVVYGSAGKFNAESRDSDLSLVCGKEKYSWRTKR